MSLILFTISISFQWFIQRIKYLVETIIETESHEYCVIKSMSIKYAYETSYLPFARKASNEIDKSSNLNKGNCVKTKILIIILK